RAASPHGLRGERMVQDLLRSRITETSRREPVDQATGRTDLRQVPALTGLLPAQLPVHAGDRWQQLVERIRETSQVRPVHHTVERDVRGSSPRLHLGRPRTVRSDERRQYGIRIGSGQAVVLARAETTRGGRYRGALLRV